MSEAFNLDEGLKRSLDIQCTWNEIVSRFADGKPHSVTFMNAVFFDGASLHMPSFKPIVVSFEVSTPEEFDEKFHEFAMGMQEAMRASVEDDMVAVRAAARAGLVFMTEYCRRAAQGDIEPNEAMTKAWETMGACLAIPPEEFELGMGFAPEFRQRLQQYLDETQHPIFEAEEENSNG